MGFFDFFPYTNWHNVNLDWVLQRVKEWGELVQANDIAFHNLEEANASFKRYVENYLADLDVQEQIDDKLDRMFESGELTEYFQPYVSDTVTDWLEEHITEPTGVVIDSSLTVSGACADAKAVGDKITYLDNKINTNAFTEGAKSALLACIRNLAWVIEDGQQYYNALAREFSNILWDYEWYSSSGTAPSEMTGTFDFNTSDGSLKVTDPNLTLLHNSKFEFVVECAFPLNSQLNNPSIAIACFDGTNSFALRLRANPTSQDTSQRNKIVYEINYASTKTFTNVVQTEYHRFRIINESTRLFLYIDDILINNWNWSTTTQVTSANNAKIIGGGTVMNIKSIKFRTIA